MKVVTCAEVRRLEERAMREGQSGESLMDLAGRAVAEAAQRCIAARQLSRKASLLVGCGNNGGDAYAAGIHLLRAGWEVTAYRLDPSRSSALNALYAKRFQECGGLMRTRAEGCFGPHDLLIDGLLGTGFHGGLEASLANWIEQINRMRAVILSIDIPSGISGTSGEGIDSSLRAQETVTLGWPKLGLFLRGAWGAVGVLTVADVGLASYDKEAVPVAEWPTRGDAASLLPPLSRCRHKYQAGLVVGMGGSLERPGAAKLSALAALRGGAGLVHLFFPKGVEEEMRDLPFEVMKEVWSERRFHEELGRARAFFVGPGLGRSRSIAKWLMRYLPTLPIPSVIDADALYFLRELEALPNEALLTPHRGELGRFLSYKEDDFLTSCAHFTEKKHTTLLVKGAPTFLFAPHRLPHILTTGDPGMATAGAGDALTGLLAALLAQGLKPFEAALLGAFLHGLAGEWAACTKSSYSLIASDLIEGFSAGFRELLALMDKSCSIL